MIKSAWWAYPPRCNSVASVIPYVFPPSSWKEDWKTPRDHKSELPMPHRCLRIFRTFQMSGDALILSNRTMCLVCLQTTTCMLMKYLRLELNPTLLTMSPFKLSLWNLHCLKYTRHWKEKMHSLSCFWWIIDIFTAKATYTVIIFFLTKVIQGSALLKIKSECSDNW